MFIRFVFIGLLFLSFGTCGQNSGVLSEKKVLLLHSYHNGYQWTDEITRGVKETLYPDVNDVHIEYMDTKRQFDSTYQNLIAQVLTYKHKKHVYDLIITSDDNAFNFITKYRNAIFGPKPVVFCGLNYAKDSDIEQITNITGVSEIADISKNIELIQHLHPDYSELLIITDNTPTGKKVQAEANQVIQMQKNPEKFKLIYDVSMERLLYEIRNLDKKSVVLFTIFLRDKNQVFFEFDAVPKIITKTTKLPIYGVWNFNIGTGIVGGYLTNGYNQGKQAASMALEILNGKAAYNIPIKHDVSTQLKFDYRELQRLNIDEKQLPAGAQILYQESGFIRKHKQLFRNALIAISMLTLSLFALLYLMQRMFRSKKEIIKNHQQLTSLINQLPGATYRYSMHENNEQHLTHISHYITDLTGIKHNEFLDQRILLRDLIHSDDVNNATAEMMHALKNQSNWQISYRIKHTDGYYKNIVDIGSGVYFKDQISYIQGFIYERIE